MNATQILDRAEVPLVLATQKAKARKSKNGWCNLIVFRLSCCCGLRASELCGLEMGDLMLTGSRPCIRVRKEITKGIEAKRKGRIVPLWWDSGTLADLTEWHTMRLGQTTDRHAPFICRQRCDVGGEPLTRRKAARRWATVMKILGPVRQKQLHIHCGRHSFISHALFAGRSLVEVRDAAGHRSINTTSIYLHLIEREGVGDIFADSASAK